MSLTQLKREKVFILHKVTSRQNNSSSNCLDGQKSIEVELVPRTDEDAGPNTAHATDAKNRALIGGKRDY
jgi:hypothetical protein